MSWSLLYKIAAGVTLVALARVDGVAQTSSDALPISVDTVRMAPGHKDYSRYTSADVCSRAVSQVWFSQQRLYFPDTLGLAPPVTNPVPDTILATARVCAARFTVENTDVKELWSMLRIFAILGNDTAITGTITRLLAAATTPVARARVLQEAIEFLMSGLQYGLSIRPTLPQELLAQLDAIGPSVKIQRFIAREFVLHYWHARYNRDSLRTHAQASLDLIQTMTLEERDELDHIHQPYGVLAMLANESGDLATEEALFNRAMEEIGSWRDGQGVQTTTVMSGLLATRKALYGKKTQPLPGTFWFNHNGIPRPVAGKLSLILYASHNCSLECFAAYSLIKQLKREYGEDLDVTVITGTRGFAPGTGPLSPADEAKEAQRYFHTYLKMPGVLLVDETPYIQRQDGRRTYQTSPIGEMFNGWQGVNAILTDRESRIRWLGMLINGDDKRMIDAAIRRAMTPSSGLSSSAQ